MNDDAFSQIITIINAIKQKLFKFDSENEVWNSAKMHKRFNFPRKNNWECV
jgi:hypothetical protein